MLTGEIYVVEMTWDGELIGSCGPLPKDNLPSTDSCTCNNELTDWVRANNDRLILLD